MICPACGGPAEQETIWRDLGAGYLEPLPGLKDCVNRCYEQSPEAMDRYLTAIRSE